MNSFKRDRGSLTCPQISRSALVSIIIGASFVLAGLTGRAQKEHNAEKRTGKNDTIETKNMGGRMVRTVFKTSNGKTLTIGQKDSLFSKYGTLTQNFKFGDPITVILFIPNQADDNEKIEEIKTTLENDADIKFNELTRRWLNKPIGAVALTDIEGNSYDFTKLKGHLIVLNFWFTTCGPCVAEMPELNSIVEEHSRTDKILFLALALDSKELVEKFLKKHKFLYTHIAGTSDFTTRMGIDSWPTHMVIDRDGIVRLIEVGNIGVHKIEKSIQDHLK